MLANYYIWSRIANGPDKQIGPFHNEFLIKLALVFFSKLKNRGGRCSYYPFKIGAVGDSYFFNYSYKIRTVAASYILDCSFKIRSINISYFCYYSFGIGAVGDLYFVENYFKIGAANAS